MKRIILLIVLLASFSGFSQTHSEKIQSYLNTNYQNWNLTREDLGDWIVESKATSKSTKITNYYIKQRYQGIEIFGAVSNVWVKNNEVVNVGNRFVGGTNQKVNTTIPVLSVLDALGSAKTILGISDGVVHSIIQNTDGKKFTISNGVLSPVKAQLVYQKVADKLHLAWDLKIDVTHHNHLWSVRIDASDGKLLDKNDWVVSCNFNHSKSPEKDKNFFFNPFEKQIPSSLLEVQSGSYRVVPYFIESPNHGARQLLTSPSNAIASPFGWHDTNGITGSEFTYTRGNNVYAFEDRDDIDSGLSPDGGNSLIFDFPYGGINVPAVSYLDAATTNLFYMNNIIHDVFYQYGFDEENGNFQSNNYGNGGEENDDVLAQSQDGGGLNNANFGTPPDGGNGRMQMYLWNRKAAANLIKINTPAALAGDYVAVDNSFDAGHVDLPLAPANLTADLVLFSDGTGESSDGCEAAVNSAQLNGKIAVIRRGGTCTTTSKVKRAQNAGAIAAILVSNAPGSYFLGGSDATLTIPAISVTQSVGESIITEMQTNTVNASLTLPFVSNFVNIDGDFDNLVIAHEYGHGISNRLTGGSFNVDCLNNQEQMGEGWSDWFGLLLQMKPGDTGGQKRGVGTFVSNQPTNDNGIRTYPYTTDMAINPFTFDDTNTAVRPHGVGSIWATMLWDLTWAYVEKYGFNTNIYTGNGGNNKVLQVVVDALKLQPCDPSFVDGRNAILAADQAITGGQDFCMIWEVFARRGLGWNASSGDPYSSTDQVEDFSVPSPGPNCTLGIDYFQNEEQVALYPNPTRGIVTIALNQFVGKINIQVIDTNGRIILEEKNADFNQQMQIDLGNFQSGLYLVKINSERINATRKIILN